MGYRLRSGFTIVELLIVIVVIAVLSAITVVSYNGMTQRSENNKTTLGVVGYGRALMMYAQQNGQYPTIGWYCLADADNSCGRVSGASMCFGLGAGSRNATFDSDLKSMLVELPKVSDQTMLCAGLTYQGALAHGADVKHAEVFALYKGNIDCPSVSGFILGYRSQQDDVTLCNFDLPTLP